MESNDNDISENNSNSSVLDLPLDPIEKKENDSSKSSSLDSSFDIKFSLAKIIDLPIEEEKENPRYIEEEEYLLSDFKLENLEEDIPKARLRSKTNYLSMYQIQRAPKTKPIMVNEYIKPLKLCMKSYGDSQIMGKKLHNNILYDFQKNNIDCKSCNDKDSFTDSFILECETEKTTPTVEDLNNLTKCRKKMKNFRSSIGENFLNEYENILNTNILFNKENNDNTLNSNNNILDSRKKKAKFWCKHIKQQKLINNKLNKIYIRNNSLSFVPKRKILSNSLVSNPIEEGGKKDHKGLFILGILESAVNDKKGRETVGV